MLHEWMAKLLDLAATPWGPFILISHAYLEPIFIPLPHDPILITVALADPRKSLIYGAMSTLAATLGMASSYGLGRWGRKTSMIKIFGNKHLAEIQTLIQRYQNKATLVACFTPVPDKLYCVMAGLMKLDFKIFVLIGFISRAIRYFVPAILIYVYGEAIRGWLTHSFKWVLMGLVVMIAALYFATRLFYSYLDRRLNLTVSDGQNNAPIRAGTLEQIGPSLDKKLAIPDGGKEKK